MRSYIRKSSSRIDCNKKNYTGSILRYITFIPNMRCSLCYEFDTYSYVDKVIF